METLKEILAPDFLLRNSLYTTVLVGFACPLVGVFLVLRRVVFMGVALPQISSTGVAVAMSLPVWLGLTVNSAEEHAHTVLYLLIGLTVSVAVLSAGPLIAFGFLLIPVLTAHLFARNMKLFVILASLLGALSSFLGFWFAYQWDWPVGPTDVVLLGVVYTAAFIIKKVAGK